MVSQEVGHLHHLESFPKGCVLVQVSRGSCPLTSDLLNPSPPPRKGRLRNKNVHIPPVFWELSWVGSPTCKIQSTPWPEPAAALTLLAQPPHYTSSPLQAMFWLPGAPPSIQFPALLSCAPAPTQFLPEGHPPTPFPLLSGMTFTFPSGSVQGPNHTQAEFISS